jgi:hypothetical protein
MALALQQGHFVYLWGRPLWASPQPFVYMLIAADRAGAAGAPPQHGAGRLWPTRRPMNAHGPAGSGMATRAKPGAA